MTFEPSIDPPSLWASTYSGLTHTQMIGIGSVISAWTVLEIATQQALCLLAQTPSVLGQALTDDLGPDARIRALKRLCDTWLAILGDERDEEKSAIAETSNVCRWFEQNKTKRNQIVHYFWLRISDEEIVGSKYSTKPYAADKVQRERYITMSTSDLTTFAKEVSERADSLLGLTLRLGLLPSWPHTSPMPGHPRDKNGSATD